MCDTLDDADRLITEIADNWENISDLMNGYKSIKLHLCRK